MRDNAAQAYPNRYPQQHPLQFRGQNSRGVYFAVTIDVELRQNSWDSHRDDKGRFNACDGGLAIWLHYGAAKDVEGKGK